MLFVVSNQIASLKHLELCAVVVNKVASLMSSIEAAVTQWLPVALDIIVQKMKSVQSLSLPEVETLLVMSKLLPDPSLVSSHCELISRCLGQAALENSTERGRIVRCLKHMECKVRVIRGFLQSNRAF